MYNHNSVDFFRFSDRYEDVFLEDNHYLYACAEPYNQAYYLTVCEYHKLPDNTWLKYDYSSADAAYLSALKPAPYEDTIAILTIETREQLEDVNHE